jgi:hypothetical protein
MTQAATRELRREAFFMTGESSFVGRVSLGVTTYYAGNLGGFAGKRNYKSNHRSFAYAVRKVREFPFDCAQGQDDTSGMGSVGDLRQGGEAEEGLGEEDAAGEGEEELAVAGFEGVGEDSADEGEEEGEGPEPGFGDRLGGDEGE